jgi:DNA polymerase III sliding clamp (beta) subunit (PCNA family)
VSNTALTMKTSSLLDELDRCIRWIEKRTINQSLQGFLFDISGGEFSISATDGLSTDITTVISIDSDMEVKMCIPALAIHRFVSEVSRVSDDIKLSFGKNLVVTSGKHRTNIVPLELSMFPDLFRDLGTNSTDICPEEFARAVKLTAGVSDPKSPFPALGSIYFEGSDAVSTDGVRVCVLNGISVAREPVLLDGIVCAKIGQTISSEESVKVGTDAGRVIFYWDNGIISVTKTIGNFPKYQALIRGESETTLLVNKQQLSVAVRTGVSYAQEAGNLVILEAVAGELAVQTVSMTGSHRSELVCEEFNGPDKKIGVSVKYLLDMASKIDSDMINIGINTDKDIVLFTNSDDYTYGVMPMYVK